MAGLISSSEAAGIRAALAAFQTHVYTRTTVSAGTDQGYGPTDVDGAAAAGLPCKYVAADRVRLDRGDRMVTQAPTLTVPYDDPIKPGDKVSDVLDSEGNVMLAGPLQVYVVEASAGLGPTLKKRAILQGGDIVA